MNFKVLIYNLLFLVIPIIIIIAWFWYDKAGGEVAGGN